MKNITGRQLRTERTVTRQVTVQRLAGHEKTDGVD